MGKALLLTPGFRFHPTDVELVLFYLKKKVLGKKFSFEAIAELDIYKHAPWDLPAKSHFPSRDLKWYFFCPREKKYASGVRQNRATEFGYWKTTGRDRPVTQNNSVVGQIKTLVFHRGRPPKGERTNWVIHEYRLQDQILADKGVVQDSYVLCMVFQKDGPGPRNGAQYGAPFREEDWTDDEEESCTEVGNSSKESVPNSLVVDDDAGSSRVPPRTCIGSPVLCVFGAMVPGPQVPKPSSGGEVGNYNSSANMPCALKSATGSGSPPDYSVSDAVALTCKLQKTLPNNDIKMDKLPDTNDGDILSLLNCFGDDEPFVRTENYKNKDTNNVNQGVAITGAACDEGVDVYEGLDDLDNSVSHTHKATCTFEEILSIPNYDGNSVSHTHKATCTFEEILSIPNYDGNSFLELRDLEAPLAGPADNEDAQLNILSDGVNNCNTDPGEPCLQVNAVDAVWTSLWPDRAHPLWQYQSDL